MKRLLQTIILLAALLAPLGAHAFSASNYASHSKLASGKWVKIQVTESGIYQITATDAKNWGFSGLDNLRVFGYGGAPISELLTEDLPDDLPAVPVTRTGDKIVFYAQGPLTWQSKEITSTTEMAQVQKQHPYSTAAYYFVTENPIYNDGEPTVNSTAPTGERITTFTERICHEEEIINPGETGRTLLGEDFSSKASQDFTFTLPGLVNGSEVKVLTVFASKTRNGTGKLTFKYNGTDVASNSNDVISSIYDADHGHYNIGTTLKTFNLSGTNTLTWNISYSYSGSLYTARLDYITINYQRSLALSDGMLCFGDNAASTDKQYAVSGATASTVVWDVTNVVKPIKLTTTFADGTLCFTSPASGRREFAVFDPSATFSAPALTGDVSAQDIHGDSIPDMIILAPSAFLTQAQRVADWHEANDSMRVLVLNHQLVFNEFSSGTPDAMAYRKICKMFYDRGTDSQGHKLGYLFLFGNGTFDNRLLGSNVQSLDYPMLLTWQSEVSKDEDNSYTTDDGFVVLGDNTGSATDHDAPFAKQLMSIAVGRFPVKSVSEARTCVNKLIKYMNGNDHGVWKNNVISVADDEDNAIHMTQAENAITDMTDNGGSAMIYNRVYLDAFNEVSEGSSRTYPDAREKMYNKLKEGVLWWTYIGHASPNSWTGNALLKRVDVQENLYYSHLPILYAACCEFTRYDATATSSGELVFLNANGGAVAVVCPPRLVYIAQNGTLTRAVGKYAFTRDAAGKAQRIGDIFVQAKNSTKALGENNLRYFVFADPAMRIAMPSYTAVIDKINGKDASESNMPVFEARQTITFTGHIENLSGSTATDFNGAVVSTLFDCEQSVTTHGYGTGKAFTYQDRSNRLAISVDTVTAGTFTIKVTIPSETENPFDNYQPAMINLYAYDSSHGYEAKGMSDDFYIYGYDDTQVSDTTGPDILYFGLNDENFVSGDNTNESPLVLATIADASGVNFSSSGIGHSITLTLDDNITYSDVSTYYTPATADEGTLGYIRYPLSDLTDGQHTLRLRVWDVYNNVSEETITFNVVTGLTPDIATIYVTPSPASSEASFYVTHNRPDAMMTVDVEVYDLLGRLIWNSALTGRSDFYTTVPITWDLTDNAGRRVPRGIYIFRATISTDGVQTATKSKKMAVTSE